MEEDMTKKKETVKKKTSSKKTGTEKKVTESGAKKKAPSKKKKTTSETEPKRVLNKDIKEEKSSILEDNIVTAIEKTMEAKESEDVVNERKEVPTAFVEKPSFVHKTKEKKSNQWLLLLAWSLIIAVIGVILGSVVTYYAMGGKNGVPQVSYTSDKNIQKFIEVYNEILEMHYLSLDKNALIEGAIHGMLEKTGDPHTSYFDKSSTDNFNVRMEGSYYGIGSEIVEDIDGNILFYSVFPNTPVEKAGIKAGDIIRGVNSTAIAGKKASEVTEMIKGDGSAAKTVTLTYERDKKEYTVTLTTEKVVIPSVYQKVIQSKGKKIGYIQITVFAANTASQYADALANLKKEKVDALIIDVRDNSGGYLSTVDAMLENTLPVGSVKYQIKSKAGIEKEVSKTGTSIDVPIVILQNVGSASGSEMLSVAYRDIYNAKIIGTMSYGKGTVQIVNKLSDGTMIKYTTKEWLSPNGDSIHGKGISPTIEIDLDEKYHETEKDEDDNQLQMAIQQLTK